jgi:hypothetical protein
MKNGWTLARRQRQAILIQNWKPWEKSTGAKTAEGKKTSSRNSLLHGTYSAESIERRRQLRKALLTLEKTIS